MRLWRLKLEAGGDRPALDQHLCLMERRDDFPGQRLDAQFSVEALIAAIFPEAGSCNVFSQESQTMMRHRPRPDAASPIMPLWSLQCRAPSSSQLSPFPLSFSQHPLLLTLCGIAMRLMISKSHFAAVRQ